MKAIVRLLRVAREERSLIIRATLWRIIESVFASMPYAVLFLALTPRLDSFGPVAAWVPSWLSGDRAPLWSLLLLAVAYSGQGLAAYRAADLGYRAAYRLTSRIRAQLVDHLTHLPVGYLRGRDTGDLTTVVMQDVTTVEMIPGLLLPRFVAALTLPTLAVVGALTIEPVVGLTLAISLVTALAVLRVSQRELRRVSETRSAAIASLKSRLLEFVQGIQVVKAFRRSEGRLPRLDAALLQARDSGKAMTLGFVVPSVAVPTVLAVGACVMLSLLAVGLTGDTLGAAEALLLFLLTLRLFAPLTETVEFWAMVRQMEVAIDRIDNVLAVSALPGGAGTVIPNPGSVKFEDVSFSYRGGPENSGVPVLRNLSFTAEAGQITAIVGATGAGKTTLARLLTRDWDPEQGCVTIGGIDLRELSTAQIADLVGVVTQVITHFSLSVRENIRIGRPDATDEEIVAAARAARCEEFIRHLPQGYDTVLESAGAALSGGEQQRLALARLFLKHSPIIILDEATSSLDVENERLVQDALRELVRGRTTIMIAHRLWTVRSAHRIVVMESGALVEQGTHAELWARNGAYRALWNALRQAPGWRRLNPSSTPLQLPGAAS